MAADTPVYEDPILRDAREQRGQELKLAEINAGREAELARIAARNADERRAWLGPVLAGLAVVAVIGAIIGAIAWNVQRDREQRDRDRVRQAQIAETCIRDGNIWINGNCIPAKKG